ncbi:crotonase/enoyl-CoA hydratase family protein [Nocardioides alcanivorans]|uniref:crotonase/enoyl-CoA hydratase family protein n=1 Tax=Nocardioides alcanivorans TaxID=2897352 RepID=UPI001F387994|nr:crotonase/enoyl-CoA hydratase family protein [Nocardioides alcanivorans]
MSTTEHGIRLEVAEDGIASVTLDRPAKKNALDRVMFDGIESTIAELRQRDDVRVVVLRGAGGTFCAGIDLAFLGSNTEALDLAPRTHGIANYFQHVCWGWRELPVPVIAAIDGVCFGGGMQVAAGADIRIAAPDARLAVMEARWGLVPDMAGFPLLRGVVRPDVLRELVYTGREVSGTDAVALGLATRTAADPHAAALELAHDIAERSVAGVRAAKRLLGLAIDEAVAVEPLLVAESVEQEALLRSPEFMARLTGR